MACVYLITSPSGKQYVGMTVGTAGDRFQQHVNLARQSKGRRMPIFLKAINRYGAEAFKVETMAVASREYCGELEKRVIAAYGTFYPGGYNMTAGGDGCSVMTPSVARRKSEGLVAAFSSPEAKKRISDIQKALWADPAEKAKRSAAIAKAFSDPETKARLVESQKRGNADPAVKARRAEIMRQRMADPEYRRKTIERMNAARDARSLVGGASPGTIHTLT